MSADDVLNDLGVGSDETKTRKQPRKPAAERDPTDTPKWRALRGNVADLYSTVAMGASVVGDDFSAQVIAANADQLADAWIKLAHKNARVERILVSLTETSALGALVMAHASVVIPILLYHGKMPGGAVLPNTGIFTDPNETQPQNGNGAHGVA